MSKKQLLKKLFFIIMGTYHCTIYATPQLKVVTELWPPYIINSAPVSGIVTNKVRHILDNSGLTYEINIYPWLRSYHLAKTTPNVLIYSIYKTPEREPFFHWFCPIHQATPIYAYKLASNLKDISSLSALKKTRIGVMRGDNNFNYLSSKGFSEDIQLDISADELSNVRKLMAGRIDVVIQSHDAIHYRLEQLSNHPVELVQGVNIHGLNSSTHCMALSKNSDKDIIESVQKAFQSNRPSKGE